MLDRQALGREAGDYPAGNQLIIFTDKYVHGRSCNKGVD
jgi:hypothetical protein